MPRPAPADPASLLRHPRAVDAAVALLALPATLAPGTVGDDGLPVERLVGVSALLGALACAALLARRAAPWPVAAIVAALCVAVMVRQPDATQAAVPMLAMLTTIGARARVALTALAVAAFAALSLAALLAGGAPPSQAITQATLPWTGLAAAVGVALRAHRAAIDAAEERARQAEIAREEQADRLLAEERLRIARDLHDVVAHQIAVVTLQAGLAHHVLDDDPAAAKQALRHVRQAGAEVMRELPALLGVLRSEQDAVAPAPRAADVAELVDAARRAGLEVRHTVTGDPGAVDDALGLATYRVVQEALTNAAKHGAGSAAVHVVHEAHGTTIEVTNPVTAAHLDPPPPTSSTPSAGPGHGLLGMRERVSAHGGRLDVGPSRDGWRVRAELPHHQGGTTS